MIINCIDNTPIDNLTKGSSKLVECLCQDCGDIFVTNYRNVGHNKAPYCKKCCHKHKKKRLYTKDQLKSISEKSRQNNLGRKLTEESKRKIGDGNRKPFEFYINLFKDYDNIRFSDEFEFKCDWCLIWYKPTKNQFGEMVRSSKQKIRSKTFHNLECRSKYRRENYPDTFFQKGHGSNIPAWNRGMKHSEETKKKISDSLKVKMDEIRPNMRKAHIKRLTMMKSDGMTLYPNNSKEESKMIDYIQSLTNYNIINQYPIDGYFIDGYISELKLCIEYDERHHFTYHDNNLILSDRDLYRQNRIESKYGLSFFRIMYNDVDDMVHLRDKFTNKLIELEDNKISKTE